MYVHTTIVEMSKICVFHESGKIIAKLMHISYIIYHHRTSEFTIKKIICGKPVTLVLHSGCALCFRVQFKLTRD